MVSRAKRRSLSFLIGIGLVWVLTGCTTVDPTLKPEISPLPTSTQAPRETETATPSPTPLAPIMLLLAPDAADAGLVEALQALLTDVAEQSGMRFQVRQQLSTADLTDIRLVAALPPGPGLAELAEAAPQIQFLGVDIPGLEPAENLSVIEPGGNRPDQVGFIAGYMAAVITQDWRVAIVSQQGSASGAAEQAGYTNGAYYFCGLCRPAVPPFPRSGYPLFIELPAGAGAADWQSAANNLAAFEVKTVFVSPEVDEPGLLSALSGAGMNLIGTSAPPPGLEAHWIASISPEEILPAAEQLLTEILAGKGAQRVTLQVRLVEINPELLSPGRQRLVDEMMADLQAGFIDTGVSPPEVGSP